MNPPRILKTLCDCDLLADWLDFCSTFGGEAEADAEQYPTFEGDPS